MPISHHADCTTTGNKPTGTGDTALSYARCMGCGGWGLDLVKAWGYCNHCTRYIEEYHFLLYEENASSCS